MVLESTVICVDNSDWMRNGDFIPNRLQAQQDAVNVICRMKQSQNAENAVGLLSFADCQTIVTLTPEVNKVMGALYKLEPDGQIQLHTGLAIARLMLKHRQNKNHKMRVIAFIGSPVDNDPKELVRLAKKLKKEKVNVDVVSFGENVDNQGKLDGFIEALNGKDGNLSHLVTVPPGTMLADVLMSSPMFVGDDGKPLASRAGFELGFDPSEDPELAMALRVSMEEQRQRHEDETQKVQMASLNESLATQTAATDTNVSMDTNESALARAEAAVLPSAVVVQEAQDFSDNMTDEEQLALALEMSMQGDVQEMETDSAGASSSAQKTTSEPASQENPEFDELAENQEFLEEALKNIEGVDPQNALKIYKRSEQKEKNTK
ncbi:26S proteasome non-ATPase regulatory subunit 4-like [Dysidea avara]|uniref:26S proteasome non-ATPase regulatory subunit 4-like n=1 Tax=Dysidea avara TaxID=196820 RepID=UPI00331CBFAB